MQKYLTEEVKRDKTQPNTLCEFELNPSAIKDAFGITGKT